MRDGNHFAPTGLSGAGKDFTLERLHNNTEMGTFSSIRAGSFISKALKKFNPRIDNIENLIDFLEDR